MIYHLEEKIMIYQKCNISIRKKDISVIYHSQKILLNHKKNDTIYHRYITDISVIFHFVYFFSIKMIYMMIYQSCKNIT